MFEKEAEEYRKDLKSKFFLSEPQLDLACQGFKDGEVYGYEKGFQEGAEFGYNKANEQLTKAKEIIRDLLSWEDRADYDYNEYDDIKCKAESILNEE